MYILACHICGEIKVISSVANEYGKTEESWTCPKCGTGQIVEIFCPEDSRKNNLRKALCGMGLVTEAKNAVVPFEKYFCR